MASTGHKKIVFCLTVVFIDKLQGRYVKLKMSNICLATTMLPSAKERLVLPNPRHGFRNGYWFAQRAFCIKWAVSPKRCSSCQVLLKSLIQVISMWPLFLYNSNRMWTNSSFFEGFVLLLSLSLFFYLVYFWQDRQYTRQWWTLLEQIMRKRIM